MQAILVRRLRTLGDPPVADARLGQDEGRRGRLVIELAPQGADVHAKVMTLLPVPAAPHLSQQPLVREELARVRDERLEQRVLGLREVNRPVRSGYQATRQIDLEFAESENGGADLLRLCPAELGPETGQDLLHPEWLGHVIVGPGVEGRDLVGLLVPDGKDDDRDVGEGPHPTDHLGAVEIGKAQIQEHQVRSVLGRCHHGLLAGAGGLDRVAVGLQARPQGPSNLGLVVHHQDRGHGAGSCFTGCDSATGSSKTTAVPPDGDPSTQMRPPCASTTARAIARPRPLPVRPLAPSPRKKGSNTRARSGAGMPGPWSATRTWTEPRHGAAETTISPPGGEYRTEFSRRLDRTWSICTGSMGTSGRSGRTSVRIRTRERAGFIRCSTESITSSIPVSCFAGTSAPARTRARSMMLPTKRFSRSVSSNTVRSSSRCCSGRCVTPSSRRLVTPALIEARGVRRSWVTEENRAARSWLVSTASRAPSTCLSRRVRSTATATCRAQASRRTRSSPASGSNPARRTAVRVPIVAPPATRGTSTDGPSPPVRCAVASRARSSVRTRISLRARANGSKSALAKSSSIRSKGSLESSLDAK